MRKRALLVLCALMLIFSAACGGGGGSSTTTTSSSAQTAAPRLIITTNEDLPGSLQGHAYTTTLAATGGTGTLHWSIPQDPSSFAAMSGLSLDATGVLSGTPSSPGSFSFTAQVTDSAATPQLTMQTFFVNVFAKLTANPVPIQVIAQYQMIQSVPFITFAIQGGVPPLIFSASSLPSGLRLDPHGNLQGGPIQTGTFQTTVNVQDSFTPPEAVSVPVTVTVAPASLTGYIAMPDRLPLNRQVTAMAGARGGTKPYSFTLRSGSLPPGLAGPDPGTGVISGTPTSAGEYGFTVTVTDSSSPPQTTFPVFVVIVGPALGRNDTPAKAARIGNGLSFASISPYIDPPNSAPSAADGDYYKLIARPGSIVHTSASNALNSPLDTVMEVTDVNGSRLNTCRLPGDNTINFNSMCLNDDITLGFNTNSALDFQVPAAGNTPVPFFVHVIDWRGDARPDMVYQLLIDGTIDPLSIPFQLLPNAALGSAYNANLFAQGGVTPYVWSVAPGSSLPNGINMDTNGVFSGAATATGTFTFTIQAADGISQTASIQLTLRVT